MFDQAGAEKALQLQTKAKVNKERMLLKKKSKR